MAGIQLGAAAICMGKPGIQYGYPFAEQLSADRGEGVFEMVGTPNWCQNPVAPDLAHDGQSDRRSNNMAQKNQLSGFATYFTEPVTVKIPKKLRQ
jgi:hypothetical protein